MRNLRRRLDRLELALMPPSDECDPRFKAFIAGLSKPQLRAVLARVRGEQLGTEQAALLASATTRLWELPAEEVAGLSPATRSALTYVAGATISTLDVPDAISRLEARAALRAAAADRRG